MILAAIIALAFFFLVFAAICICQGITKDKDFISTGYGIKGLFK